MLKCENEKNTDSFQCSLDSPEDRRSEVGRGVADSNRQSIWVTEKARDWEK